MDSAEGIEALRRAILSDAADTARNEVEQAKRSVEFERQAAQQEAEAERQEILRDARRQAEVITRRIASATDVEAKRRQIELRERLLREVFEEAFQRLRAEHEPSRSNTLMRLVLEAAREIGGGSMQIQVAPEDVKLVTLEFIKTIEERLAGEGIRGELTLAEQPVNITGGAILSRENGKLVVDNSFEARMERQETALRGGVWQILQQEEAKSG